MPSPSLPPDKDTQSFDLAKGARQRAHLRLPHLNCIAQLDGFLTTA
ncbi:MAG: hypothetical protein LKKZDAJK_002420 [Candidatus Fervidibacter sp.]